MEQSELRNRGLTATSQVVVDYLPEPFAQVMAHTEKYSCLAYLDAKGIWRRHFGDKPLTSRVIAWEPL